MDKNEGIKVLFATTHGEPVRAAWAEVFESGREALAWWGRVRPAVVFADFGALLDGMTGPRLAQAARARGHATPVYLLAERPRPDQLQWARVMGASGVIARDPKTIAAYLPMGLRMAHVAVAGASSKLDDYLQEVAATVARRLNEAGFGPVARMVVTDTLDSLLQKGESRWPSEDELTFAVGMELDDSPVRSRFLASSLGDL